MFACIRMQQSGCQTVLLPRLRVSELNLDAMEQEDEMNLADMPLVEEWEDGKAEATVPSRSGAWTPRRERGQVLSLPRL